MGSGLVVGVSGKSVGCGFKRLGIDLGGVWCFCLVKLSFEDCRGAWRLLGLGVCGNGKKLSHLQIVRTMIVQ